MNLVMLSTLVLVLAMLPLAMAAHAQDKTIVTLGTATPGGGFPAHGDAVAQHDQRRPTPRLSVQPRNTKGSAENIPLLEAGQLDIALGAGEAALEALNGIGRPPAALRVLAAMYATPGMFVVRADSPYRTIDDLKGKPVAFGAKGSGLVILRATSWTAWASTRAATSKPSSSTAPATDLPW